MELFSIRIQRTFQLVSTLENTLEWKMQRSPFILYSYYGTILIHIKLAI